MQASARAWRADASARAPGGTSLRGRKGGAPGPVRPQDVVLPLHLELEIASGTTEVKRPPGPSRLAPDGQPLGCGHHMPRPARLRGPGTVGRPGAHGARRWPQREKAHSPEPCLGPRPSTGKRAATAQGAGLGATLGLPIILQEGNSGDAGTIRCRNRGKAVGRIRRNAERVRSKSAQSWARVWTNLDPTRPTLSEIARTWPNPAQKQPH